MELLRLAGSPGVGKSAVGWAAAERIGAQGLPVAYVDIDQLGACYPAPADDPYRWQLKERALGLLAEHYLHAGVARLIVSGVVRSDLPPPGLPGIAVRSLWLDADAEVRLARLAPRRWDSATSNETVRVGSEEAARLHRSWERLSTDDLSVEETVDVVLSRWAPRGAESPVSWESPAPAVGDTGRVLWITGPRCVGASTVGWLIASDAWQQGRRTGFVDIAQLSFTWNVDVPVGLTNGVALQQAFVAAGAERCVVVAPLELDPARVRTAFGDTQISFVRLTASATDLHDRALARTRGEGPQLAGDDLLGAAPADVRTTITALADQQIDSRPGESVVETSGCAATAVQQQVITAAGW